VNLSKLYFNVNNIACEVGRIAMQKFCKSAGITIVGLFWNLLRLCRYLINYLFDNVAFPVLISCWYLPIHYFNFQIYTRSEHTCNIHSIVMGELLSDREC